MAIKKILLLLLIFLLGGAVGFSVQQKIKFNQAQKIQKNIYLAFSDEVWEKIQESYWDKISEEKLAELFVAADEKLLGQPQPVKTKNKETVEKIIASTLKELPEPTKKKEYVTKLCDLVLANLAPFGRSRLYTQKEEKALSENVQNINSEVNQYEVLGVPKSASSEEIEKTYQEKKTQLESQKETTESKQKLAELQKAHQVLGEQESRQTYDSSGAEPTVESKFLTNDIYYIKMQKFSPTTFEEIQRASEKSATHPEASTLIFDLHDNIGGAIDGLPYFLGPFIGPDQYAYQFFHQGEKTDYKTKIGWLPALVKFKKVIILINEKTQSTAEVMAATLKKYNVGILVGTTTKGWGTVEKVFEMNQQLDQNEKYSIFLVHSLALREDGQPIEGHGVEPAIDIKSADWEKQLSAYFPYPELIKIIKELTRT